MVLGCEPNIRVVAGQYLQRDGHAAVPVADGTKPRTPNRAKKWRRSRSPVRVRACPKDLPHVFEGSYKGEFCTPSALAVPRLTVTSVK